VQFRKKGSNLSRWLTGQILPFIVCGFLLCQGSAASQPETTKEGVGARQSADLFNREIIPRKNRVLVSRTFVEAVIDNKAILLSTVALRQHTGRNGRVDSLELVQVDKGSPVAKMGFKSGDHLCKVNGIAVGDLDDKRAELEASNRWELMVLRQGKHRRIVIEVRE
jgi:hypothetical protein